eukprot:jgi/Tetstr1/461166/TSEL_006303.t1
MSPGRDLGLWDPRPVEAVSNQQAAARGCGYMAFTTMLREPLRRMVTAFYRRIGAMPDKDRTDLIFGNDMLTCTPSSALTPATGTAPMPAPMPAPLLDGCEDDGRDSDDDR